MRRALLVAMGLGVLASLVILAARWSVEAAYRDVEIVLDGPDWEMLAAMGGVDAPTLFAQAREHRATSVAVYERTLLQMAARGELVYRTGGELLSEAWVRAPAPPFADLLASGAARAGHVYVAAPPEMLGFLEAAFTDLLGTSRVRRTAGVLEVAGFRDDLEEAPLGYMPDDLQKYIRLGLRPVLRLRNYPGLTAEGLQTKVARLARLGRGYTVVFDKTEVLGYEKLLDETAAALRSAGYVYGRIEVFSARRKQRGEDRLAQLIRPDVIRLFSLTAEELLVLTPASTRDKFVRAARERNIRILYIRPILPTAGIVGTEANLTFLDDLTRDLTATRLALHPGPARALADSHVRLRLLLGAVLGALAAMVLALDLLGRAVGIRMSPRLAGSLVGAGLVVSAVMLIAGPDVLWRKLLALGTASTVPVLAVAAALPRSRGRPAAAALGALWVASAVSVAGGLLVAALLSGWEFMMAADSFLGVKVAHLIPVVLVGVVLAALERPPQHWRDGVAQIWAWSSRPLLVRYAIAAMVIGVAAVILLARSGNFGLPLPAFEERLRTLAEDLLVARPRTKEYLIGHPALLLAAGAAAMRWRMWVVPLAAVGAIGQAGIINSFSHIHTPLIYSAWRTANALVLGSVLGLIGFLVLVYVVAPIASRLGPSPPGSS